jgi:hypothetical protein
MFPALRMRNIFNNPDNSPVDFNSGNVDISPFLDRIAWNRIHSAEAENDQQTNMFNMRQNEIADQDRRALIAHAMAHAASMPDINAPKNVVLGPGALSSASIGLAPDKDTILGLDPKTAALGLKNQQFGQTLDFKKEQADLANELKGKQLEEKTNVDTGKLGISASRAEAYRFKATHPNWIADKTKGGTLVYRNPQDPTQSYDTGIDQGTMTDEDKQELIGEQQQQNILTRGNVESDLQDKKGNQVLQQIAARTAGQKDINAAKPVRSEQPTQTRVRENITVHKLINQHPEVARYVTFNGDGTFTLSKNTPTDVAAKFNQLVYGSDTVPAKSTTNKPTETAPTAPSGWKYVKKPDGSGWTAVKDTGGK